jgi:hypothetical protein
MISKRQKAYRIDEEELLNMQIAEWIWDSHNWEEYQPGYFKCLWCGKFHTSSMGIDRNMMLCQKNPIVLKDKGLTRD